MKHTIQISLRAGETIFINGAMVRVDRKTSLEFLNTVTFLLESHMLKPSQATTPLKKMYTNLQKLLVDPEAGFETRQNFYQMHTQIVAMCPNDDLAEGLIEVKNLVNSARNFEALKTLRKLFVIEDMMLKAMQREQAQNDEPIEELKTMQRS